MYFCTTDGHCENIETLKDSTTGGNCELLGFELVFLEVISSYGPAPAG